MKSNSNKAVFQKNWNAVIETLRDNLALVFLVLHDEYGFGRERIGNILDNMTEYAKQFDDWEEDGVLNYEREKLTPTITTTTTNTPLPPQGGAVDGFSEFWQAYPKKTAKQAAIKAWNKIKPDAELQQAILNALEQQKRSVQWQKDGGQFIPYPATWLNGRRWEDTQIQAVQAPPPTYEFDPNDPYKDWR